MSINKFINHSFILTEKDTWVDLDGAEPSDSISSKLVWIHMECDMKDTAEWLYARRDIDENIIESLLAEDTRPRTTIYSDGYFINLRGVNLNNDEDPHNMISVRMFVQHNRIISTSKKPLHAVDELASVIKSDTPPLSAGGVLLSMIEMLVDKAEDSIIDLKDKMYDLEYKIIDKADTEQRRLITEIRRAVIVFSRFFLPQRDAVTKLASLKESLFTQPEKQDILECINKLNKFLEDLDALDNRCYVLQDEVAAITNDKINKKMYYISVLATLFLPLSFLTGLFGVNLGGIPGAASRYGFGMFIALLVCVLILQVIILKKSGRF